jgi:hypothetical protein
MARLEHRRPHDERHVADVDVAARRVEREVEARADERAGHEPDERGERLARELVDADDERDEREDAQRDPQALGGVAERGDHAAHQRGQRMGRRRPVGLVHRHRAVERLARPEHRVVRVVVRVRRIDQEADQRSEHEQAEGDPRPGDRGGSGQRPRPGEGRALHGGK